MTDRLVVGLRLAAVVVGVVAVALWTVPPRVDLLAASPSPPGLPVPAVGGVPDVPVAHYDPIVQDNVFAADRRAPPARYTPRAQPEAAPAQVAARPPAPRLYGIARGPSGAVALIDADRTLPGAEIYRAGERVGPYELQTVGDTFVVLVRNGDSTVLRLQTPEGGSGVR